MSLHIWKQPAIEVGKNPITMKGGGWGTACSLRGYYDFKGARFLISAVVELGYKSVGFLEGYVIESSPIIMLGIGFRNQYRIIVRHNLDFFFSKLPNKTVA